MPPYQIPDIVINKRIKILSYYKRKSVKHNWNVKYNDEILGKGKSNINVNTAIPELSNISNILEQVEPTISYVNDNLTKQERKALKQL